MAGRTRRRGSRGLAGLIATLALAGCGGAEQADLLVTPPRLFDGEQLIRDGAVAIRGDLVRDFALLREPILIVRGGRVRLGG